MARTAKQRAAQRKAALASARKRKGRGHFSRNRGKYAVGAAVIAGGAVAYKRRGKKSKKPVKRTPKPSDEFARQKANYDEIQRKKNAPKKTVKHRLKMGNIRRKARRRAKARKKESPIQRKLRLNARKRRG